MNLLKFLRKPSLILPPFFRTESADIEKICARLFTTPDGQRVLGYLSNQVFARALGMDAPDSALRYQEGQRALMATILRMIERGRQN